MPTVAARSQLSSELRISVMRLARRLRAERSDPDLSLTQISTLGTLDRYGPLSPGELAEHERVQPPSMTRTVASLVERGLVTRSPHPLDRRQVVVSLTSEARRILKEDRRWRDAWLSKRLEELDVSDRMLLAAAAPILERLAGA